MSIPGPAKESGLRLLRLLPLLGMLVGALARPAPAQVPGLTPTPIPSPAKAATEKSPKGDVAQKSRHFAVVGATVFPVSRPMLRRGTVVWKDGKIEAVGSEIEVPEGTEVISGEGLYVAPGFVSVAASRIGVERTQGDIQHSLDPYDFHLRISLAHGITTVQLIDGSRTFGFGRDSSVRQGANSAIIKLTYGDLESMLVREPGVNFLSLPSRQVELNLYNLRDRLRRAAKYLKEVKEAEAKKAKTPKMPKDIGHEVRILRNERPTVIRASGIKQVEVALDLHEEYGFDLVLDQPDDAWPMAAKIAARQVPVLLKSRGPDFNFDFTTPALEEGNMVPIRRPAAFVAGGATVALLPYRRSVALTGLAGRDLTALPFEAAFAVRGGLSEEEALRAITLNPAKILKIADRVGSLEKGKDADLLLLSGHPLDFRSFVLKAYINGKLYYEREKSRLFKRVPLQKSPF